MIDWYRQRYRALKMTAIVILGLCNASSTVFPARSYKLCDPRWLFRARGGRYFTMAEYEISNQTMVVFDRPWVRLAVPPNSRRGPTWRPSVRTDHSAGLCNCGPWERTYRRITSCRCGLTVRKCWARSALFRACGGVSRGLFPRFRGCELLYLRTVEYDQWLNYSGHQCRASYDLALPWGIRPRNNVSHIGPIK